MQIHQVLIRGPLLINKHAAQDPAMEVDFGISRVGSIPDLGVVVVVTHSVQAVSELVETQIENGAWSDDLDEAKPLSGKSGLH